MLNTYPNRIMEQPFLGEESKKARSIQPAQLRRLHALWRRWTGKLGLLATSDRQLRHYYVELFTQGRARETRELTESDAWQVVRWLEKLAPMDAAATSLAAGTAGRRGYPEQRQVRPNRAAWRALWGCAAALGMQRSDLEDFIRWHYARGGLRGVADLRTMADLNRVLWGLKAMLRRDPTGGRAAELGKRAA